MSRRAARALAIAGALFAGACSFSTGTTAPAFGPMPSGAPLRVRYLGVGGFLVERGSDAILTAPLFTRPSWLEVTAGNVASNPAIVDRQLPPPAIAGVSAVLSGHAHYDHLLDVPTVLSRAPRAMLFGNRSARNILAAWMPERGPRCRTTPPAFPPIARGRVVAVDDPFQSVVDYTMCPSKRPPHAPAQGRWMNVPGAAIRVLALCSEHPDQLGPMHYAPGGVEDEQCSPLPRATDWLEGGTVSYLIDFLDPRTGAPSYRVYYQDAPTSAPAGLVPPVLLREKRIDIALLCVGAYERVVDAPASSILGLGPRYVLGGHWEDFSRAAHEPPQPIPLLDLATWSARARATLPRNLEAQPMLQNGAFAPERWAIPRAGELFEIR